MTTTAQGRFHIHVDTRVPRLVDALAGVLRTAPSDDPMVPQQIVVQSQGMARWLSLQLAERLGIAAHHEHPTPRTILDRAFSAVIEGDDIETRRAYDADRLTWTVAAVLNEDLDSPAPELAPLRRYVGDREGDPRGFKPLQLARRIAVAFDDYAVYRPHMVLDWDAGTDRGPEARDLPPSEAWQPVLWRAVDERAGGGKHFAARRHRFLAELDPDALRGRRFPRRLCLFGLSSLPPSYVDTFVALAGQGGVEIHLFLLVPALPLWTSVHARREEARAWLERAPETMEQALGPALAHPLLASQGQVALGFHATLAGLVPDARVHTPPTPSAEKEGSLVPAAKVQAPTSRPTTPPTLLARLQSGLRTALAPEADTDAPRPRLAPEDDSLRVHSCHGPMREVEVLRDQILDWLRKDPSLSPADIVVLAPVIEDYAPYIEATFGLRPGSPGHIPFRIADRAPEAGDAVSLAFARVLDLMRGRLSAPEVLDLLELPPIRARFGIAAEAVEGLRERVREAGIRWGADGAHRAEVGQPAQHEHTWRFGLDRLLLGHAWEGEEGEHSSGERNGGAPYGGTLFKGTLPVGDIEGAEAEQVGRLADLCETLFAFRDRLAGRHRVETWRDELSALLDATVQPDWDEAWQVERLRRALHRLVERAREAGFHERVDLEIVRGEFAAVGAEAAAPRGFITGALTFCALVPMRSVPFRCVALLGMSDGTFPRPTRRAGFDLLQHTPHLGDLTPREADRAMALEALLAAEERLAVTYVGQSARDNRALPPSVVVSEWLDVAVELVDAPVVLDGEGREATDADEDRATRVRDALVVRHAIQPFSPSYFTQAEDEGRRLFSYAGRYLRTARAVAGDRAPARPFFERPLADTQDLGEVGGGSDEPLDLSLGGFGRFLANPAQALLQQRLSLFLGREEEPLEAREPFDLDGLGRWRVGTALLPHLLEGREADAALAHMHATGWLPPGTTGTVAYEDVATTASALATAALRHGADSPEQPPLRFSLPIGGVALRGSLHGLRPAARLTLTYARGGGRRELDVWLAHLVLLLLREGHGTLVALDGERLSPEAAHRRLPPRSVHVARGGEGAQVTAFGAVEDPQARLAELLALRAPGLRQPLPLFEGASRTFAEALAKGRTEAQARQAACKKYRAGRHNKPHDQEDAYVLQAWGEADPTADEAPNGAALRDLAKALDADGAAGGGMGEEAPWAMEADPTLRFAALAERVYGHLLAAREELDP